ncbi:MAG: (Fe-S)-binding protein [Chloroflexi bacterium]|nr:(Fe-S)-binding protein [Chloroflexota bacterium]
MEAFRISYWGIPGYAILIIVVATSLAIFGHRVRYLYRHLRRGQAEPRLDRPVERARGALGRVLGQVCVLKDVSLRDRAGLGHFFIFYGFLLFSLSYLLVIGSGFKADFTSAVFTIAGAKVFHLVLDIAGVLVVMAVIWALARRYLARPQRLEPSRDAIIILGIIGSLMIANFFTEAFEAVVEGESFSGWVPVGSGLSRLFQGLGLGAAGSLLRAAWWLHLSLVFVFLAYVPYSKHLHIAAGPLNIFFRSLRPKGALSPIDLEATETYGVAKMEDFTWRGLLDTYACTECSRCRENCCTYVSQKPLSPKKLVQDLKKHLLHAEGGDTTIIGKAVTEDEVWGCSTCRYCQENCPVAIEHVSKIVDLRRNLVLSEGRMPEDVSQTLRSLEARGHPWRGTTATRTDWAAGLKIKTADEGDFEYLYWVGCTAALEERNQKVAQALVSVLQSAKVDFAILGEEEVCCGDPARRMGNEYLYQMLAKNNIEILKRHEVKKILTSCPHCFNTLKNEYTQFGGDFQVMHHSQLLHELAVQGRIKPKASQTTITYHDPCYLGRYNGIYDVPRELLSAVSEQGIREMARRRSRALCCGGGGGHLWMEENIGQRINQIRIQDALDTGASTVAVACPYCLAMFEDAIKAKGAEEKLKAMDVAELMAQGL